MPYDKPWKSYEEQLDQLIERGMEVTDRERALDYLERIGYYRLSGYWYSFRERSGPVCLLGVQGTKRKKETSIVFDAFRVGSLFQDVVALYVFDKRLRLLVLDALERIEVALRVDISQVLGELDAFAYLNPRLFYDGFSADLDGGTGLTLHHKWLGKHARLIADSKEKFIKHHKEKYGLPLPIWVACEVWDFGTMSTLYGGMREPDQDTISRRYGLSNGRDFATWLRSLNYLRNVCAHHGRLWNRNIDSQPVLPPSSQVAWVSRFVNDRHAQARCFMLLEITRHLMAVINPRSTWPERMKNHLHAFPDLSDVGLDLGSMGVRDGWEEGW